jgi:hypothetical protein
MVQVVVRTFRLYDVNGKPHRAHVPVDPVDCDDPREMMGRQLAQAFAHEGLEPVEALDLFGVTGAFLVVLVTKGHLLGHRGSLDSLSPLTVKT